MFAKIYETEIGQILITKDTHAESCNPEVRTYFEPEGLGVCSISATMKDDSEDSWSNVDKLFDNMTEEEAVKAVKSVINKLLK